MYFVISDYQEDIAIDIMIPPVGILIADPSILPLRIHIMYLLLKNPYQYSILNITITI